MNKEEEEEEEERFDPIIRIKESGGKKKMNTEERENVHVVTTRLVKAWLELRQVIYTLPEGEDVERLIKGKALIEAGLGIILLSLEAQ